MDEPTACDICGHTLPPASAACPNCATLSSEGSSAHPSLRRLPVIEGYRFLGKIGEGGMGEVYLALDTTLDRRVAVKMISSARSGDDRARGRFLREARAMATVEHPHLVRIYSFGESDGTPYLVMEHIEGENLGDRLRGRGRLSLEEAVEVARQIAEALGEAWEHGIVHRDIKPSNVLLDARDRAHVADFGLAKPVGAVDDEAPLTQAGHLVGTPHYLSPEQARGEEVDLRSDIYSLGILLYQMLSGQPPFRGASPMAVVAHHLHTRLPSLRESRPDVPPGIERLVLGMTEKDPRLRPQSYAELLEAITDALEPPARWSSGSPYRGLAAFDFEHAPIFFGRSRAVEEVSSALRAQAASGCSFVLVLGMSGSGKSSLLRAGVLPALVGPGAVQGVTLWRRAVLRPADSSGDLFDGLAAALTRAEALPELGGDGATVAELAGLLRGNPRGAPLLVRGALSQVASETSRTRALDAPPEVRLVLLVDQMEELFTLERIAQGERAALVEALSALARSGRVWVLATLRSDFFARCEELPELMSLKEGAGQYHLLPPSPAEVAQMIRQPARAAGLEFEREPTTDLGLDEVVRDAATSQAGNLPLLEFALEELYRKRTPEGVLTHEAYEAIGGIEGALARRAEEVAARLPQAALDSAPAIFAALARVASEEKGGFVRRYALADSFTARDSRAFVDAFVDARLFVADRDDEGRAVISIAHEALLRAWPRLESWLQENRELLRARSRVAAAAELWVERGRPADLLLVEGKPLEEAAPLLELPAIDLSREERELVQASIASAERRRQARRIANAGSVGLILALGTLIALTLWRAIPTIAHVYLFLGETLPLPTRLLIASSNWTVWLSPLIVGAAVALYLSRGRLRLPDALESGIVLAIVAGVAMLLSLIAFLSLLFDSGVKLDTLMRWGNVSAESATAALELRSGDAAAAVHRLRSLLGRADADDAHVTLALADAYVALGDDDRALSLYRETVRRAEGLPAPSRELLLAAAGDGLQVLEAQVPRLGIRSLDATASGAGTRNGTLVAAVNRGSPAFTAGLRAGDVIQGIDGTAVADRSELVAALRRRTSGDELLLDVSREGRDLMLVARLAQAPEVFAAGCDAGHAEDCASLGTTYQRGEGVAVDVGRAADLYRRACDAGEPSGCVGLGLLLERGVGVAVDAPGAVRLYQESCDAGDPWGCHDLGILLVTGTGVAEDPSRGAELLSRSCAEGLPEACASQLSLEAQRLSEGAAFLGGTSRPYTR